MSKKGKRKGAAKALKGLLMACGIGALGGGAFIGYAATQYDPRTPVGTKVMDLDLSGLTKSEAESKLVAWWGDHQKTSVKLESEELAKQPGEATLDQLGVTFDPKATAAALPYNTYWDGLQEKMNPSVGREPVFPKFSVSEDAIKQMAVFVEENGHAPTYARVKMSGGKLVRSPERGGVDLDEAAYREQLSKAVATGEAVELPLIPAKKKVPDEALEQITDVMATFSTKFNAGQANRSSNIKTAAEIIDGIVLMPGEKFSFNDRVGRRTTASGFKVAGVYVAGRHDYDVGGGICQVSSTLYNALLLANTKIVKRFNHSLPVPYVPLGQDATVSFPNPDLIIENSFDHPIALSAEYKPGRLEFRVLGKKVEGQEITIERGGQSSWANGTKYVNDPSLAYGVEKVVDRGGNGHRISTWRVVKKDGKVVKRESLGTSTYSGGPRIVARNPNAKKPEPTQPTVPGTGGEGGAPAATGSATLTGR